MEEIDIIAYFLEGDYLVVSNPCKIPLNDLVKVINKHKKRKDKDLTTFYGGYRFKMDLDNKNVKRKFRKKSGK